MADGTHAGGRPSKYDGLDLAYVKKLASVGLTDMQMAALCGVCLATWHNWKHQHPEFLSTLKNGKRLADKAVEKALYQRALGYWHPEDKFFQHEGQVITVETIKHYPPDVTACIFWLKNRQPNRWRDKTEVATTAQGGVFIVELEAEKPIEDEDDNVG